MDDSEITYVFVANIGGLHVRSPMDSWEKVENQLQDSASKRKMWKHQMPYQWHLEAESDDGETRPVDLVRGSGGEIVNGWYRKIIYAKCALWDMDDPIPVPIIVRQVKHTFRVWMNKGSIRIPLSRPFQTENRAYRWAENLDLDSGAFTVEEDK